MSKQKQEPFMVDHAHPDESVIGAVVDGCLCNDFVFAPDAGIDPVGEAVELLQKKGLTGVRPEFINVLRARLPDLQTYTFDPDKIVCKGVPTSERTDSGSTRAAEIKSRMEGYAKCIATLIETHLPAQS